VPGVRAAHPRAVLTGFAVALSALALGACGSSSSSSSGAAGAGGSSSSAAPSSAASSTTPAAAAGKARVGRLEHALVQARSTPAVTAVTCRLETASQRGKSPFGTTGVPVYACSLTAGGVATAYDVQLLASGCFVAERVKPGKAIYGCGAGKV
jgi:hypothetical protein